MWRHFFYFQIEDPEILLRHQQVQQSKSIHELSKIRNLVRIQTKYILSLNKTIGGRVGRPEPKDRIHKNHKAEYSDKVARLIENQI